MADVESQWTASLATSTTSSRGRVARDHRPTNRSGRDSTGGPSTRTSTSSRRAMRFESVVEMRVILDTNVLLATIPDDVERADEPTRLLDRNDLEFVPSSANLMELRAVSPKKQGLERDDVEGIVRDMVALPIRTGGVLLRSWIPDFTIPWIQASLPPTAGPRACRRFRSYRVSRARPGRRGLPLRGRGRIAAR